MTLRGSGGAVSRFARRLAAGACAAAAAACLLGGATAAAQDAESWKVNEREYLERPGANVLVFSTEYNGMFFDEKTSGIVLVLHEARLATGGAVRLNPAPEQWDPIPKLVERKVDKETGTIEVRLRSVNDLLDKAEYIGGLVDQGDPIKQIRGLVQQLSAEGKGLEGIDPKRPFGAYAVLNTDVESSPVIAMIPIADEKRLLAEEPKTLQEIGDEFGVSRERARQLEKRIIDKARVYFKKTLGQDFELAVRDDE